LKAPQTAQGAALILRIDKIAEAFEKGELAPKQVQRFAVVPLQVAGPTGPVIEGISDMHFLGDGSLVLLANSPKGMPSDGGGALWWLKPGAMPELLRRFPGYKPEGITTTAEGTALLIVFDRDRQQPAWLLQPLPSPPAKAPADQAASLKPKKGH
jgi:hypothetical protein